MSLFISVWSMVVAQDHRRPCLPHCRCESGTCYHWRSRHCRLSSVHWRRNCFADLTTTHTSGNSSIDTSIIRDIYCGPEALFETCVAMKFVDDDDDENLWNLNAEEEGLSAGFSEM